MKIVESFIQISLKFAFEGPVDNKLMVWVMAWYQTGDKPLSEPIPMVEPVEGTCVNFYSIYNSFFMKM